MGIISTVGLKIYNSVGNIRLFWRYYILAQTKQDRTLEDFNIKFPENVMDNIREIELLSKNHKTLVITGIHGNEYAGILAAQKISPKHISLISPINIYGARNSSRYNEDGYDLNRDFKRLRTKEIRSLMRVIKELKPELVISLHEGPQTGNYLMIPDYLSNRIKLDVNNLIKNTKVEWAKKSHFGQKLSEPGIFIYSRTVFAISRLLRLGTLEEYLYQKQINFITLETNWSDDFDSRVEIHEKLIKWFDKP